MVLSKKELGLLVKEARKIKSKSIGHKYTQEMLAKDLGLSRGYIGDIENGRTYPNYVLLNKIAEVCGVPFSFFDGTEDEQHLGFWESLVENDIRDFMKSTYFNSVKKSILESTDIDEKELDEYFKKFTKKDWIKFFNKNVNMKDKMGLVDFFVDEIFNNMVSPEEGVKTLEFKKILDERSRSWQKTARRSGI